MYKEDGIERLPLVNLALGGKCTSGRLGAFGGRSPYEIAKGKSRLSL
ncbi:hypothetical protein [Porphyromonas catoniae]